MTSSVVGALAAALAALDADDRERALAELLVAWRELRHPRIADVIDFVSAAVTAARPAIKGKTMAARNAAWEAIEAKRDPADLGRLLAIEWPKLWQNAVPILERLVEWPDDPRLAMAFAKLIVDTSYVTYTSGRFYTPLFRRFNQLRDLRTLPLLRAQGERTRPNFGDQIMRPLEHNAIARLEAAFPDGPPAIPDAAVAALAALEARFATKVEAAKQKASGDAELLAAIYAAPDDLPLRGVYADWLQERGDPRGELIALQLAPRTEDGEARERKLIEQHGKAWAGALDKYFDEDDRLFEGGFFAGGPLHRRTWVDVDLDETIQEALREPAWSVVRALESSRYSFDDLVLRLVDRRELRSVRSVHGVRDVTAAQLAAGQERALVELSFWTYDADLAADVSVLATCPALPQLATLGLRPDARTLAWFDNAPVLERLARLVIVREEQHTTRLLEAVAARAGNLRDLELSGSRPALRAPPGWHVRLVRDIAPGSFTHAHVRYRTGKDVRSRMMVRDLEAVLATIPAGWLKTLEIDAGRKLTLKAEDRGRLDAAVKRFANLEHVSVPWAPPVTRAAPTGLRLAMNLVGEPLLDPAKLDVLWPLVVGELGQAYDAFEIGYNSTLRSLGDNPLAKAKQWAANKRTTRLELIRDGHDQRWVISRGATFENTRLDLIVDRSAREIIAWLARFLDAAQFRDGACGSTTLQLDRSFDLGDFDTYHVGEGWLLIFGGAHLPVLPVARVEELASRHGLAGLSVVPTQRNLIVAVAETPDQVTSERLEQLSAGLRAIIHDENVKRRGYDFVECAIAVLGPVAEELGLVFRPTLREARVRSLEDKIARSDGSRREVRYVHPRPPEINMVAQLIDPLDACNLNVYMHTMSPTYRKLALSSGRATTRGELETLLATAATNLRAEGAAWLREAESGQP